jgi:hypothetical protein
MMNEKIKELILQINPASKKIYEGDWEYNCAAWTAEELETFAQMIVYQCIEICTLSGTAAAGYLTDSKEQDIAHDVAKTCGETIGAYYSMQIESLMICPKCEIDRSKNPCSLDVVEQMKMCPMIGTAQ